MASSLPNHEDVRTVISGIKINNDLERIADLAGNISQSTVRYLQHPPVKPLIDIPRMAELAQTMLRDSLNSYVRHSTTLGTEVVARDALVDDLEMNVSRELVGAMLGKSETIESALDLILISRHVERIADHAASIAAEVIFMVSGRDIRHQRKESSTVS
ncbi:MAG: PhoU domain-containing protein [Vicinamibacterales bacterium]